MTRKASKRAFEAVIDGSEVNTIDPVVSITINNGFHDYVIAADEVRKIEIRPRKISGEA